MVQIRSLLEALDVARFLNSREQYSRGSSLGLSVKESLDEFEECIRKALDQWRQGGTGANGASGSDWAAGYAAGYAAGQSVHPGNVGTFKPWDITYDWSNQRTGSAQGAANGRGALGELGCGAW